MSAQETARTKLINQLRFLLGAQLVDVELDVEHYNTAIELAIDRFRQRSSGATEESYLFITAQPDQQAYTLPDEVQEVRKLYRRGVGANSTGGTNFDPFEAAFSNIYMLQSGRTGGLETWDFFSQFQETVGRIFGSDINFTWEYSTRTLTLVRKMKAEEDIMVHVYNTKPEITLLDDIYSRPWLRDYSLAVCKQILASGRGKFSSGLPGPGGNVTFDADQLRQEAASEMERLEQEIQNFNTSQHGMPFIIR